MSAFVRDLSPERARELLAAMAKRDFDRIARAVRVGAAQARGIQLVPPEPGPEFRPRAYACDLRPAPCTACAQRCEWYAPSSEES